MLPDLNVSEQAITYTADQIKSAWDKYQHHRVLRVLKDGKWFVKSLDCVGMIDGTRAEVIKINQVMSFPKYLEKKYGK